LVLKLYELTNQAPLSKEQLQTRAMHWAGALIEAGIPRRRWDEVATLARKCRSPASKAFAISADQIIDVWEEHILRGKAWAPSDDGVMGWQHQDRKRPVYCGDCTDGQIYTCEEGDRGRISRMDPCDCALPQWIEPTYHYRRWCAAYEVATGQAYEPKKNTLRGLYDIYRRFTCEEWDAEIRRYFDRLPQDPSLSEFWKGSEVYARDRAENDRRQKEERRREEISRKYEEERRRHETAKAAASVAVATNEPPF
jgi:hypothetical protein